MPPFALWLFGLLIVLVIVVAFVAQRRYERKRTEALGRVASEAGLAFEPRGEVELLVSLGELPLYSRGRSRRAKNVMSGLVGDETVRVMDYQYTTGSGKHQSVTHQTVVVFPQAAHSLPDMQLAPENPLHRLGEAFGYQDIDFDSNPEFSSRYVVRGPDETAIRAAFYPDTLAFLAGHQGWTIEVRSGTVGIYRAGRRSKPDEVRPMIEEARQILGALKSR